MSGRTWLVISAVGLLSLAGGCGGSAEDQIRSTIQEAYAAFADGDAAAFCEHLTADFRADFEDNYGPCEDATLDEALAAGVDAEALRNPEIGTITVEDDAAYPDVNGEGLEVELEDGKWRLDDFDPPVG
jgi:ketosteroid isomerase-like protein